MSQPEEIEIPTQIKKPVKGIIILHPGSQWLRFGLVSDISPHSVIHAIARKIKPGSYSTLRKDFYLPAPIKLSAEQEQTLEEARLSLSHTLQACLRSDGRRRFATPPQQVAAYNRRQKPEPVEDVEIEIDIPDLTQDVITGDAILNLPKECDYHIQFPWHRGQLNIQRGIGGSLTAVLADLEVIWRQCIESNLHIEPIDFEDYRVVLIVPAQCPRSHMREIMTVLLQRLGFGGAFLVQDHVAATFGAGLPAACVVDVGAHKTSVSCVEDGISHLGTRVHLEYGGCDVSLLLAGLLKRCAFPLNLKPWSDPSHFKLVESIKHQQCHAQLDICGPVSHTFVHGNLKFQIEIGDEALLAPLALFHPELLAMSGLKNHAIDAQKPDPEDPHDAAFIRETSRRYAREMTDDTGGVSGNFGTNATQEQDNEDDLEVEKEGDRTIEDHSALLPLFSLDQVILASIEHCPEELKRKMYACVLLVGGGLKFAGVSTWLHNRLRLQIPLSYRSEHMELVTCPKELGPEATAWKGAAVMACIESSHELWIRPEEWSKAGVRLLRERAPFIW